MRKSTAWRIESPIWYYTASKGEGLGFRAFAFVLILSCFYRVSSNFGIIIFYYCLSLCFYKATRTYTYFCNPYITLSTTINTNLSGNHPKPDCFWWSSYSPLHFLPCSAYGVLNSFPHFRCHLFQEAFSDPSLISTVHSFLVCSIISYLYLSC